MHVTGEPIAIIGTGCRFPGDSTTPSKLWDLLREPRDLLEPLIDRFNSEGWYHENGKYHGHTNVRRSYQLAGEGCQRRFDAQFFGINAVEADTMDPQMRLLLETVYEALEAAGQPMENLRGSDTAVYTGMMINGYKTGMERDLDSMGTYHVSGVSRAMMSNRLSYFFDWHGPSMTIDTACSSSMIAVHQAVMQLRSGQSRVAIAAGSNLLLDPADYVAMSNLEMLSPDGRSRMWDEDANGYARGEGVAAVVLKTLGAAKADGDHIECVIRETATNQDGKTPGITMPSATAQAQLMRDCYTRAGLDPTDPNQRPQYFEAHGTGTPAGDPIEAEAIKTTFFPGDSAVLCSEDKLLVGGIKTVIGHSESTAGLAGLIKTSLALQNSTVPPNLLLGKINPKVEPFYQNLRIPKSAIPWPTVRGGCPRRASVNSFGFGGANAHVILESYAPIEEREPETKLTPFIPFVFSAASEASLRSNLASVSNHLRAEGARMDLRDLAMTLHSRRSRLHYGTTVSAGTIQDLSRKLEEKCQNADQHPVGIRPSIQHSGERSRKPEVLGVFTGQGAQSARMGAALIENSKACERIIDKLEARLDKLPVTDRPSWSLKQELLRDVHTTGVAHATLSQPLCTALQILQVDLLRAAGVEFSAVVGHSSGEIGAAYCAGIISAEDAICIAYYRGLYSDLAIGPNGQKGAMLAVGASYEDAQDLCSEDEFQDRISVAAINSSASVTLSGDKDAIDEAKVIFEDEKRFARILKVDKAYHSCHMARCSSAYIRALQKLGIQPLRATTSWFSSVEQGALMVADDSAGLEATYWNDNMVKPVLFMQAIEEAWKSKGPFDLALEVGPHPALKGPTLQTIQDLSLQEIPYIGVHVRGEDAVESFADALGFAWTHLASVNLSGYDRFLTGVSSYDLITGLPPYSWDHDKEYWHESRYAKAIRMRSEPHHELLGHLTPDSTDEDMRWRNIISPKELTWLKGHALQQQAVFPAAGYVVAAIEAAAAMVRVRELSASLIEVLGLDIGKALAFDGEDSRVETITALVNIQQSGQEIEAQFNFNATPNLHGTSLTLIASGRIRVLLGDGDVALLPARYQPEPCLHKVDAANFYESLEKLDYQYTGPFRALSGLKRKLGFATGYVAGKQSPMLVHPGVLDAAFQSLLLAYCAPNSGALRSLHVPRKIRAIRLNPLLCVADKKTKGAPIAFDCLQPQGVSALTGDVEMFAETDGTQHAMIQVEGLLCVPFSQPSAQDDRVLFSTVVWDVAMPDAENLPYDGEPTAEKTQLAYLLECMAIFFLRRLDRNVPKDHPARSRGLYVQYFNFASHILSRLEEGKLLANSAQWDHDSEDVLAAAYEPYVHIADVKLLKAIGDNIIDIATEKTQAIEIGMENDMLSQMYTHGLGFQESTNHLACLVRQIVHRYPHMSILEVGAGTGGATKKIFHEIGRTFATYTYTDISSGFFDVAQTMFPTQLDKMIYKTLDISKDVRQQGYSDLSYDLIVASAVLHATPNLQDTLKNVRRLLRPGGFLVVLEPLANDTVRMGTVFGALPGWWVGADEGRTLSPCVNPAEWDGLLRATGFSGCDTVAPIRNSLVLPITVFVSQAVDRRVDFLRSPLDMHMPLFEDIALTTTQNLVLLGGSNPHTLETITQLKHLLRHQWGRNIKTARSLADVVALDISSGTTVLSLVELDGPVFQQLTDASWESLKLLLHNAGTMLWVSCGRRAQNPYANMIVGLLRSAREEIHTLDIQSFNTDGDEFPEAHQLAKTLLQLKATTMWQRQGVNTDLLMTAEPEVVCEQSGALIIPRLIANREMNDRYNSSRRPIYDHASIDSQSTENIAILEFNDQPICLQKVPWPQKSKDGSVVQVTHSMRSAVWVARTGFMHLVLGIDCESGQQVVALTTQHALMTAVLNGLSIPVSIPAGNEEAFLALLSYQLLASVFLESTSEGTISIIHEADPAFATILTDEAQRHGMRVVFTTTSTTTAENGWLSIHPLAPERVLRALLPDNAAFLDLSGESTPKTLGARLRALLPSSSQYHTLGTVFKLSSDWEPHGPRLLRVQTRFEDCVFRTSARLANTTCTTFTVSLDDLEQTNHHIAHTVIDWSSSSLDLPVKVLPADSHIRFSDCKTYWLAGLSGGLGLLLCEWMVRHGAKYFVISSRKPKIQEQWLEKMRAAGAIIEVFACDMIDKSALSDVYHKIRSTLPDFAGVCQGAMVLQDTAIRDMSLEDLLKVTRPKVEGSLHLDQIFQAQSTDLDFFIFFSSGGSVVGRPGQSNYAAANLFMTALAEQRRQRGQAASVMHIGPIFGVGYMTQQGMDIGNKWTTQMKSVFPISEQDFCQHFAEAVLAGHPGAHTRVLEITSGVARFKSLDEATNPFLSHYTPDRVETATEVSVGKSRAPLKSQLAEVRGRAQLASIILEAFLIKLSVLFQTELSKLEHAEPQSLHLDGMGIDSLIAVEIRGWFVKTLQVNIPVLKILSGSSVADLVAFAVETIPESLVPSCGEDGTELTG